MISFDTSETDQYKLSLPHVELDCASAEFEKIIDTRQKTEIIY